MRSSFADSAAKLAGVVAVSLGWTPDQFWSATPAELLAIFSAYTDTAGAIEGSPLSAAQLQKLKEDHPDGQCD